MKKIAVITGATKGIGLAIAHSFAKEGMDIAICARNEDLLKKVQAQLEKQYGISCLAIPVDVSKKEEVLHFAAKILALGNKIEVIVNNAGVFIPGQIKEEESGVLEQMIDTNLYSAYHLTRALIPSLIKAKDGHVITMCSTASTTPYINGGSYCISKYALYGMTKVLREELKQHNIRVTAILPGATFTDSWTGSELPEERFMKAEDVASVVVNAYHLSKQAVVEEITLRPQLGDL